MTRSHSAIVNDVATALAVVVVFLLCGFWYEEISSSLVPHPPDAQAYIPVFRSKSQSSGLNPKSDTQIPALEKYVIW